MTTPLALILLISPSQRQSTELLLKVKDAIRNLPYPIPLEEDNKLSITLANRARIVSLPANEGTIRGFSAVNLLIEDEAADVPDELHTAARPMLATSNGQLILMGTPKGRQGHFFESWERGGEEWTRIKVAAAQIPRYTPGFLEGEKADMLRRGLGEYYRQEYECEFVNAAAGRVYSSFSEQLNLITEEPHTGNWTYLLGLDFGIRDENALTVMGWREHDPCVYILESYRKRGIPSEMAEEVKRLSKKYDFSRIVGDVGGMGKAFAEEARQRFQIPIEAAEKHNKLGFISLMNGDLATGKIKVCRYACDELWHEWLELPWAEGAKKEAEGFNNHAADSALYAWRACAGFLESPKAVAADYGTPEWKRKEQDDMLVRDLEEQERQRDAEWWK